MAHANHFSSRRIAGFGAVLLGLTACASQQGLLDGLRLTSAPETSDIQIAPASAKAEGAGLKPTITPAAVQQNKVTETQAASMAPLVHNAMCDYLQEDTAAQTAIMRAPTLSGSVDDSGKANVSLGMSLTGLAKAQVMEDSAEARCRRYLAESGLQKLVFLSPQGLTSAGFKAKSDAIMKRKKDIQALRRNVAQAMADGMIDREKATNLMGFADQLLAEAAQAKSQADRRTGDFLGSKDKASLLGKELMRAEADLEDLNSRMRTFDSVDVSVSAGWSDDLSQDHFNTTSSDFSGKVSFSMKLGAFTPGRYEHEERAKQAKLQSIADEGGALWQVNVLRLAHERAIEGLEESRRKIDSALAESNRLLAALKNVPNPEFQFTAISARFKAIQLASDKAAVEGSLAEIRTNLSRLKTTG